MRSGKLQAAVDIDDLLGRPFAESGQGPDAYDCWGLCREVCRRAGISLPPAEYVCDLAARHAAIQAGKRCFERVTEPEPYCVAVFERAGWCAHMGVVLPDGRLVHVLRGAAVVAEPLRRVTRRRKLEGYYRCVGTDSHD